MWKAIISPAICQECFSKNGRILSIDKLEYHEPPIHSNCHCWIELLQVIQAGTATNRGTAGADWYIKYLNELPDYYITKKEARNLGWVAVKGNLSKVAPKMMIFGGVYRNDDRKLPHKLNRVWYEADINYESGYRNKQRILFSNDGLIFVTYDHYKSFYEIE